MESDASQEYYPRLVGLAPPETKSISDKRFELLVTGRDKIGGLAKLTSILALHKVNLAPSGGYYLISPGAFIWTTFIDLSLSKSPLERVLNEIRRLEFVSRADAVELKGIALDKFLFPVDINGRHRGIIMNLSSLLEVEQRLTDQLGSGGPFLMFEEGKVYAKKDLQQLREIFPESKPNEFLDMAASWFRTTGWGLLRFDVSRLNESIVSVEVREGPNSSVRGSHESHFMDGVVVGVIEFIFNRKVSVTMSRYDEPTRTQHLILRATA